MRSHSHRELEIVHYGHPALRERAAPIRRVTDDVRALVGRMAEVMHAAHGLGLAANQLGIPRRVAVVEIEGELTALIDPEMVSAEGAESVEEGCLSLPRLYGDVPRPTRVVVRARDLSGKRIKVVGEGLLARALCHEVDHLDGRLFIDTVAQETLHWLVGGTEEGEQISRPTTLEDALRVFTATGRSGG